MGKFFKGGTKTLESTTGPWKPAQATLQDILAQGSDWMEQAQQTGYISPTGDLGSLYSGYLEDLQGLTPGVQQDVQQLLQQAQSRQGLAGDIFSQAAQGGLRITPEQILTGAEQFSQDPYLEGQIQAAQRPLERQLQEVLLPGAQREGVATGGLGGSREAIQEAVLRRGIGEKEADIEAGMRGDVYRQGLGMSQQQLQQNLMNQLASAGNLAQLGQQQFGQAGALPGIQMGALQPQLTGAQVGQMTQAQQQMDLMGQRDYMMDLLGRYAPLATGIGSLGTQSTKQVPTKSGFQKLTGAIQGIGAVAAPFMGGMPGGMPSLGGGGQGFGMMNPGAQPFTPQRYNTNPFSVSY